MEEKKTTKFVQELEDMKVSRLTSEDSIKGDVEISRLASNKKESKKD